jgi:ferrous-iron efflux pump FieF
LPDSDRQRIRDLVTACKGVLGVHDIRTRSSGPNVFIQLHLELDDDLPLKDAHDRVEDAERVVEAAYPNAEVLIHPDPRSVVPAELASK